MEKWPVKRSRNQIWADSEGHWARIIHLRLDNVVFYDFNARKSRQMERGKFEKKYQRFVRGGNVPPQTTQPQASA